MIILKKTLYLQDERRCSSPYTHNSPVHYVRFTWIMGSLSPVSHKMFRKTRGNFDDDLIKKKKRKVNE